MKRGREEGPVVISAASDSYVSGMSPGAGTFSCVGCNSHVSLRQLDDLPDCPRCRGTVFRRASMFDPSPTDDADGTATMIGSGGLLERSVSDRTIEFQVPPGTERQPHWLAEARASLPGPGRYFAWEDDGIHVHELDHGWNRVGRSVTADLRLDDPTVSRRHALVVWEEGRRLRVLDDRSLNGIYLNGELVEWAALSDGDQLAIGRYRLVLIES
ncbi:MAG TPA: FHA domain-containing protein [Solirubrobacterales bacterium]|nr:FHA domain-containing protein [Solirubrobacterales bacterium]